MYAAASLRTIRTIRDVWVKTVLYPAIALMNRLSFGMKFGLISVLFFLPLLITSFYLVRDAYRQFSDTRIELQSLTLLGSGLQIRRLESLNDLLQINAVIGQSGKAGDLKRASRTSRRDCAGGSRRWRRSARMVAAVAGIRGPARPVAQRLAGRGGRRGPCRARAHGRRAAR